MTEYIRIKIERGEEVSSTIQPIDQITGEQFTMQGIKKLVKEGFKISFSPVKKSPLLSGNTAKKL